MQRNRDNSEADPFPGCTNVPVDETEPQFGLLNRYLGRVVTAGAANGVATAGAQLRFRDVKPEQELVGAYVARHAAVTFSGLAYEMLFFAEGDERWATIELAALADDAAPRAEHFNDQVEGWAFLVSEDAYERLTRALDQVAEPVR